MYGGQYDKEYPRDCATVMSTGCCRAIIIIFQGLQKFGHVDPSHHTNECDHCFLRRFLGIQIGHVTLYREMTRNTTLGRPRRYATHHFAQDGARGYDPK